MQRPLNHMRMFLAADELRSYVENWPKVAAALLMRARHEAMAAPLDLVLQSTWRELLKLPDLPAAQFAQLLEQCREAKHQLLGKSPPDRARITVLGGGSKLIAAQRTAELTREQALQTVVHGFFPEVELSARPHGRRSALTEFGLPFAADPAITRHVAAFLGRQAAVIAVEAPRSPPGARNVCR